VRTSGGLRICASDSTGCHWSTRRAPVCRWSGRGTLGLRIDPISRFFGKALMPAQVSMRLRELRWPRQTAIWSISMADAGLNFPGYDQNETRGFIRLLRVPSRNIRECQGRGFGREPVRWRLRAYSRLRGFARGDLQFRYRFRLERSTQYQYVLTQEAYRGPTIRLGYARIPNAFVIGMRTSIKY